MRSKTDTASATLLRRAASVLANGWYTCERLGICLYGTPGVSTREARMSMMVRARRPLNRMNKLGILAKRVGRDGIDEYTLLPDGMEVLGC